MNLIRNDGDPLRHIACDDAVPPHIRFPAANHRYNASLSIMGQLIHLLSLLAQHMREQSAKLDKKGDAFQAYRTLAQTLQTEFDVGAYNLNY